MTPPLWQKVRGTKELLDEGERGEWKSWLKTQYSKTKIIASSPITSWQIDGETMETVKDFIFLGSKITEDGNCSHEIERHLLLGGKAMTNLDRVLKSRDITLPTKVHIVKAMVFPVVTYGCESWTINKDECRRIDAFELWCWRRPFRVPWTATRSNQSILKEINPEYSLEVLLLKLKPQYFGHLMRRTDSFEKTLMLGKRRQEEKGMTEDEMVGWHHRLNAHEFEQAPGVGDGQGSLVCCSSWGGKESETTEWLNNNCAFITLTKNNNNSLMSSFTSPHAYFLDFPNLLDLFPSGSKQGPHNIFGYVLLVCFTW